MLFVIYLLKTKNAFFSGGRKSKDGHLRWGPSMILGASSCRKSFPGLPGVPDHFPTLLPPTCPMGPSTHALTSNRAPELQQIKPGVGRPLLEEFSWVFSVDKKYTHTECWSLKSRNPVCQVGIIFLGILPNSWDSRYSIMLCDERIGYWMLKEWVNGEKLKNMQLIPFIKYLLST